MSILKSISKVMLLSKLDNLEKKRAKVMLERKMLKGKAQALQDEYEACLDRLRDEVQNSAPGTVVRPASIPSKEKMGEPGK